MRLPRTALGGNPRRCADRDLGRLLLTNFGFGRRHLFEALHLFQKVAAIDYVIELDCGLAAAESGDELFEGVDAGFCAWIPTARRYPALRRRAKSSGSV